MPLNCLPEMITHTFHPEGVFLANLCDLPTHDAERVLDRFRARGARRKSDYLNRRLETEAWLIEERKRLLVNTHRTRPIYFFLGNFADGKDASRPCSLIMPLKAFAPETLTFTFPDSMASLSIATLDKQAAKRKPYHGKLFSAAQIEHVIGEFGFPGNHWQLVESSEDRFIEVQVWDERPIIEFVLNSWL
ncbi:hypothetical protein G6K88_13990 [Agrobacterium rhizogenes]|uniref:hypothetical protein n=1 Tax=Rhizobium rhizogenes TaxID=359 RepID=UPI00115DC76F|nr:hypothetical protein [Rhizobium rhizogenes]NTG20672.1 hypothetical protein [Rhizobium rhizogenes]NTH38170.1 hypothetical protein [Rhizobium rhizogenes]NTI03130.1 hypothetical protein [Rhizobium rhizogenes]NTI09934.1 hypothetical protein [Rhizobium rhizogenes]NTJ00600.1 hypothetical protein [Rhizobium rhizogenes]